MNMNKFFFTGNLTRDVDLRYTADGRALAKIDIAVNGSYKDKAGEKQETVNYFRLTCWDKPAEAHAEYLGKGSRIRVEGHMKNDNYEKESGQKVYGIEFIVDEVEYLSSKKGVKEKGGDFTV